ncbi:methyl-accepting chemotaxis protein [Psychromonas sp. SP041]|uniref:methyl-accepting chemotaxis protein n=1 Tax=Psychromonas sp. SP041 TaxID=1365007 RepID=UPI00046F9F15|nr:methyl-accepting chemotaxis protein [Psychromonas sp. SP041]
MLDNMSLRKRLAGAFSILIIILIIMSFFAVKQMHSLSNFTQLLYKHPFSVSVAIVKIESAVTSMHSSMKDVALASSIDQINNAAANVDAIEKQTLKYFDVLNERFLGNKSEIIIIRENFINWRPIRNEVITLMREGKRIEALKITKEKDINHIQDLNQRLSKLEDFAANKANEFTKNSLAQGESAVLNLIILVSTGIILAILLSWRITLSILRPIGGEPKDIEVLTHQIADGDLSIKFKNTGKETGIYLAMQLMVEKLKVMMKQISDSAISQTVASEGLALISVQTKKNIAEQSHATEQVATAINQMHATSEEVARNTSVAADATEAARLLVDQGTLKAEQSSNDVQGLAKDLDKTTTIITELAESTEDIAGILAVIKGISDQTNLLALNAAIEAARAGEFGRGFSVVADEVRSLASNTQKSTAEIEAKISKVQESAKASVESMKIGRGQADIIVTQTVDVQQALADIKNAVYQIIDMNSQIASAAEEQSSVAAEVGKQVVEIKELSYNTGVGAEEVRIATEELAQFATQLSEHVTRFKM